MDLDFGIEQTKQNKFKLQFSCCKTQPIRPIFWSKVKTLVSTLPLLENIEKDRSDSFFETTLTYNPKKILYDGLNTRIEKMMQYLTYLDKNKFNYWFLPEYHTNGDSAGLIHWHGIIYGRDYVATMKAVAYWTRNMGRVKVLKKDFNMQDEKLNYKTWITYCTKDKDKMDYTLTPIACSPVSGTETNS